MPLTTPEGVEPRQAEAQRRDLCPRHRGQDQERRHAPSCASAPRCRAPRWCWRTRPAASWRWSAASPIRPSQLNRTTQALRQPGSSIKPIIYLAALHRGLQPNTLVQDSGVTLPPIPGVTTHHWSPKNYDGGGCRHDDAAPRAGAIQEHGHGAAARRRHRQGSAPEPGTGLRAGARSQDLRRVHEELSVRARRAGAAHDRSRRLLRRHRQRRAARHALRHRFDRAERQAGLSPSAPRSRSIWPTATAPRSISCAPSSKAWWRAAPRPRSGSTPASSAARPAPPTTRTTPGSSASPATSPSRSGSATTTPAASRTLGQGETGGKNAVPIAEQIIQATWQLPRAEDAAAAAVGGDRAQPQGAADRRLHRTEGVAV